MVVGQRIRQVTLAAAMLFLGTPFAVGFENQEPHLYVFSMPGCRPCQQMAPDVDRLIQAGYPVTKVDCVANEAWANHFQITQTPTTVLVVGQRVVARTIGPLNYVELIRHFEAIGYQPGGHPVGLAANAYTSTAAPVAAPREPMSPAAPPANPAGRGAPTRWTAPQAAAHQATIRITVADPQGTSYATGTVIHQHGDEYLAITCGHVFRDSNGTGTISVDFGFDQGNHASAAGQLIQYDADARDVGLVAFRTRQPIIPAPIAPQSFPIQPGDQVFSLGCDHGQDPSLRTTQILRTALYDGAHKYDIAGRPVDGRSGGGLFSAGGQLIGICNAAAVNEDEGVYSALENIYWQLSQARLTHLFQQPSTGGGQMAAAPQFEGRLDVRPHDATPAIQGDTEIIMMVRSRSHPENVETISIPSPSAQLLGLVQSLRQSEGSARVAGGATPTLPLASGRTGPR